MFSTTHFVYGVHASLKAIDIQARSGLATVAYGFGLVAATLTSKQASRVYRMAFHLTLALGFTVLALCDSLVEQHLTAEVEPPMPEADDLIPELPTLVEEEEEEDVITADYGVSIDDYTIRELKAIAKENKLPGYSRMTKPVLFIALLDYLR